MINAINKCRQGMVLLTVSGSLDSLRPPACKERPCVEANGGQNAFLLCALGLIALGTGGIKPCVSSFRADQYDEADEKKPYRNTYSLIGFSLQ